MRRQPLVWLAACALALVATPALAQQTPELGAPVVNPRLPKGTVTVAFVNGSFTDPVVGTVVALEAEGQTARRARTDAKGRAIFTGLDAGTSWVAKIEHEEETFESQPIPVPTEGGVQVVMSPVPWEVKPTGTGDPPMSPTKMSSQARGDQSMEAGSIQIRVVHGAWNKPAVDHDVYLVGLQADGSLIRKVGKTDASGRVTFSGLRGRDVAYYALTMLDHDNGDERLMSVPIQLPPRVGMKMVLSGAAPGSATPDDDLNQYYRDQLPPPEGPAPGQVELRIGGAESLVGALEEVELLEVGSPDVIAKAPARDDRSTVQGGFVVEPRDNENTGPGVAMIGVVRSIRGTPPIDGAIVELLPTGGTEPLVQVTDKRGVAEFTGLQIGVEYTPTVVMFDQRIEGQPFTTGDKVGIVTAAALNWEGNVKLARFSALPWGNEKVYVAQARIGGTVHRSPPFQLTSGAGAIVPLPISGPPRFQFHVGGLIHDEFFQFDGSFAMSNGPVQPYALGEDVFIPLPRGFVGARVREPFTNRVKVLEGEGLLWKGAVPPGGLQFELAFTMRVEDGEVPLDWALPYGAVRSSIAFEWNDAMSVDVVGRARGRVEDRGGRKVYIINDINVPDQQRVVMKISGLPQEPAWRRWTARLVGIAVLLLIIGALASIFSRRARTAAARTAEREARRERLLEELVELERKHADGELSDSKYQKARARIVKQLEPLYDAA